MLKNIKNFFYTFRKLHLLYDKKCWPYIWLIVKKFFVWYENFARSIVIIYNKLQFTLQVGNWGSFYWDHNEGELLQKIGFFFLFIKCQLWGSWLQFHVSASNHICEVKYTYDYCKWTFDDGPYFSQSFLLFYFFKYFFHNFQGDPLCPGLPYMLTGCPMRRYKN